MLDVVERHLADALGATSWHSADGTDPLAEPLTDNPVPAEVGTTD
jgi:hypothetical protein